MASASTELSSSVLKKKFRGCMIGALVGDCLGSPFEYESGFPSKYKLAKFLNDLTSGGGAGRTISIATATKIHLATMDEESKKWLFHTDDTRMTLNIASSIVERGDINLKHVAEKFVADYFSQTKSRGYGMHVRTVFRKLKETHCKDIFKPASEQFDGKGSYGNGGAMRIAPIALFGNGRGEEYIMKAAKENALITHAHPCGYRGAMLQCLAVNAALNLDPSEELDPVKFTDDLIEKMEKIEKESRKLYCNSLKCMKKIFVQNREEIESSKDIAVSLGNGFDTSALTSVTPAIYSFLRGMKPIKNYTSDNPFMRTMYFAISIGGDTDTIASMAGAIAGAYHGEDMIPDAVQKRCEGYSKAIALADKLFDVTYKEK